MTSARICAPLARRSASSVRRGRAHRARALSCSGCDAAESADSEPATSRRYAQRRARASSRHRFAGACSGAWPRCIAEAWYPSEEGCAKAATNYLESRTKGVCGRSPPPSSQSTERDGGRNRLFLFLARPLDVQRFPDDSEMRRPAAATPGAYCGSESRSQRPKPRRGPARVLAQRPMRRRPHGCVDHRGSFRVAARGRGLEIRARRLSARLGSDASGEPRNARGLRSGRAGKEASAVASSASGWSALVRLMHALSRMAGILSGVKNPCK